MSEAQRNEEEPKREKDHEVKTQQEEKNDSTEGKQKIKHAEDESEEDSEPADEDEKEEEAEQDSDKIEKEEEAEDMEMAEHAEEKKHEKEGVKQAQDKKEVKTEQAQDKKEGQTEQAQDKKEGKTEQAQNKKEGKTEQAQDKKEGKTEQAQDKKEGKTEQAEDEDEEEKTAQEMTEEQKHEHIKSLKPEERKKAQLAELKKYLSDYVDWKQYEGGFNSPDKFDVTLQEVVKVSSVAVLKLLAEKIQDPQVPVDENKRKAELEKAQHNVQIVVNAYLKYIENPFALNQALQTFADKQNSQVVVEMARVCFAKLSELEELRKKRDTLEQQRAILTEEKIELEQKNQTVPPKIAAQIAQLDKELEALHFPSYLSISEDHQDLHEDIALAALSAVFESKQNPEPKAIEMENTIIKLINSEVWNPSTITQANTILFKICGDPYRIYEIGKPGLEKLKTLKKISQRKPALLKSLHALQNEAKEYRRAGKEFPETKKEALRKLELEKRLLELEPSYSRKTAKQYDKNSATIASHMIDAVLQEIELYETKNEHQPDDKEVIKTKGALNIKLQQIVAGSIKFIDEVVNLVSLARTLKQKKLWALIVLIGQRCDQIIDEKRKELDDSEKLKSEFTKIEEQRVSRMYGNPNSKESDEAFQKRYNQVKAKAEELAEVGFDKRQIDKQVLDYSSLVIEAAKQLNDIALQKRQAIIAFRAEPTIARWNKIKEVTADWEKTKHELVGDIIKSSIQARDKVILLLENGLFQQSIEVMPKPTGQHWELDLLKELWEDIEANKPDLLHSITPILSRFTKKYIGEDSNFDGMAPILALVKVRFPDIVVGLFTQAVDILMMNLQKEVHQDLVTSLQKIRDLLGPQLWPGFSDLFKEKYAAKKKLIEWVSLVDQGRWDDFLEQQQEEEEKRRARQSRGKKRKVGDTGEEFDGIALGDIEQIAKQEGYNLRKRSRRSSTEEQQPVEPEEPEEVSEEDEDAGEDDEVEHVEDEYVPSGEDDEEEDDDDEDFSNE